jgi:opacity protein-like surface antigen
MFGGYGMRLEQNKRIYLGGELNATAGNYTRNNLSYSLGASFMPGVMVTEETMIYTRLGVSGGYTDYHIETMGKNASRYSVNPLYGLGVQTKFTDNWDLRGEYTSTTSYKTGVYSVGLVYKFS